MNRIYKLCVLALSVAWAWGSFAQVVSDTLGNPVLPVVKPEIVSTSKNWSKFFEDRKGMPITTIVLHASFDPKHPEDLTYRRMKKIWDRYHASVHFVIEPSGRIIEMVPVTEAAIHATRAKPNHNPFSIGIELLHVWNGEGSERRAYSLKQLAACRQLIQWLKSEHSISKVISHRAIAKNGKKDPNMTPEEWKVASDEAPFPDPWPRSEKSWMPDPKDR
ncbi:MAG: N-acetylmuramoyl-L-alanine amidase [bacterium]|nr:N-acetylmuramoyl-L-alanine amidase [bacterium]